MNGVELLGDAMLGPFGFELTVPQALSFGPVGDRRETVVLLQVIETSGLHLSPQPFPSVEADLDGEREPGLNASIEEAEDRMDLIVIEEQALARHSFNCSFFVIRLRWISNVQQGSRQLSTHTRPLRTPSWARMWRAMVSLSS